MTSLLFEDISSVMSQELVPVVAGMWRFCRRQTSIDNRHLVLIIRTSTTSYIGQVTPRYLECKSMFTRALA